MIAGCPEATLTEFRPEGGTSPAATLPVGQNSTTVIVGRPEAVLGPPQGGFEFRPEGGTSPAVTLRPGSSGPAWVSARWG